MSRKYVGFDIETAKEMPEDFSNWRSHRPIGISCAATIAAGASEANPWHGRTNGGLPAPRMDRNEAMRLVRHLQQMSADGYTITTWNGLGFDFDVLAEESGMLQECRRLALSHVDMMFHVFCQRGHPLSLDAAAKGMGLSGKTEGMSGMLAPQLWAQGEHERVLGYVAQDARTTLDVAELAERRGKLRWTSSRGKPQRVDLPDGWLTVEEAIKLPLPDTSWMTRPMQREAYTAWLGA